MTFFIPAALMSAFLISLLSFLPFHLDLFFFLLSLSVLAAVAGKERKIVLPGLARYILALLLILFAGLFFSADPLKSSKIFLYYSALAFFFAFYGASGIRSNVFVPVFIAAAVLEALYEPLFRPGNPVYYGTVYHHSVFASVIAAGGIILFAEIYKGIIPFRRAVPQTRKAVSFFLPAILSLLFVLLAVSFWNAKSRSAVLALSAVSAGFIFIVSGRWGRFARPGIIIAGLVIFLVIPNSFIKKQLRLDGVSPATGKWSPYTFTERMRVWQISLRAVVHRPLFGYGLGSFKSAYGLYKYPVSVLPVRYGKTSHHAHSSVLNFAVEAGLPAVGVAGFILFWIISCVRRRMNILSGDEKIRLAADTAVVSFILIQSGMDIILEQPAVLFLFFFFFGRILKTVYSVPEEKLLTLPRLPFLAVIFFLVLYFAGASLSSGIVHYAPWTGSNYKTLFKVSRVLDPLSPGPLFKRIDTLEKYGGDPGEKEKAYSAGSGLFPSEIELKRHFAVTLFNSGKKQRAIEEISGAIKADPYNAMLYYERALMRRESGLIEEALCDLLYAIELEPNFQRARRAYAGLLLKKGDRKGSAKLLAEILKSREEIEAVLSHLEYSPYDLYILETDYESISAELRALPSR